STASMRSVTAAVILVPPSSLCGTPAPGRRHDGHHNDPSYLLQRPAGHPHPVVGTTDTTTIRHTSSNHSAYTDMSSALKPVSNNESPSCQVITSSDRVPMTLPAIPLVVSIRVIRSRGIQKPTAPSRSTSTPSAYLRNVPAPLNPTPRVTTRSCQRPARVVAT